MGFKGDFSANLRRRLRHVLIAAAAEVDDDKRVLRHPQHARTQKLDCLRGPLRQSLAVGIEVLKQELSALDADEQRQMTAYLVSLQDSRDSAYRRKLAEKIDRPAAEFETLGVRDYAVFLDQTGEHQL